jgi:hypothetical protein
VAVDVAGDRFARVAGVRLCALTPKTTMAASRSADEDAGGRRACTRGASGSYQATPTHPGGPEGQSPRRWPRHRAPGTSVSSHGASASSRSERSDLGAPYGCECEPLPALPAAARRLPIFAACRQHLRPAAGGRFQGHRCGVPSGCRPRAQVASARARSVRWRRRVRAEQDDEGRTFGTRGASGRPGALTHLRGADGASRGGRAPPRGIPPR